ncbi:MAG: hypothetical protein KDD70_17335, partial [Bdellovibrionales bacterium]|nr:hypothetical protein [Bdellovibrionales bacterium]
YEGHAELAVSNALGGLAVQTAFIAVADLAFVKANLEHSAASLENIFQGVLLILLLSIPLLGMASPEISIGSVHPVSFLLLIVYGMGLYLVGTVKKAPMWWPKSTDKTVLDAPDETLPMTRSEFWIAFRSFLVTAILVSVSGYLVAEAGIAISVQTGLSETLIGTLLLAISTSLPELVTSVAAVRQGAPTLAVSDILGGNSFEILFLAFSDFVFTSGPLYAAITDRILFLMGLSLLLISLLLFGLIRREKYGIFNIGLETFLIIVTYSGAMIVLATLESS